MSLSVNLSGWYLQISFSPLHPLMVICLARAIPIPASVAQFLTTNDVNLHSILGCHTINSDTHCYAYRASSMEPTVTPAPTSSPNPDVPKILISDEVRAKLKPNQDPEKILDYVLNGKWDNPTFS